LFDNIEEDFCRNLVENCFLQFFEKYILKYPMCHETNVNFVGSVAFYYKELLIKVADSHGIRFGRVLETPIGGLVEFHQK
jgi:hypothetical protein